MKFTTGQIVGALLIIGCAVAIGFIYSWLLAGLIYLMFLGKNIEKL